MMIDDCGPPIEATRWPLPDYAHQPGRTPRPQASPAFNIAASAPLKFNPERWEENQAYLYGFVLYRAGYFWEAHEVWEAVWQSCRPNSRERRLLQGLIQLANAELKRATDRSAAARRLLAMATEHLGDVRAGGSVGEAFIGVDVAALYRNLIEASPNN